ncbi:MAG TPA: molybdopterin cofactor-binding domain-containing protein [Silvibacterium sp.]|nr:molybdopterin cofactor-binding domain-containing protein [Silvibacterium sp.]
MVGDELEMKIQQPSLRERLGWFGLDRRDFLKLCGGGLLVCLTGAWGEAQESGRFREHALPDEIGAWIHIDENGQITVFTGKVEIGQNIRTSLAQLVAEELRVPFNEISMVMGDTDLTPWDMGTFGSRSTPTMGPQLRNMASAARQMLVETAARLWNVNPATLKAANGSVTNPRGGQSLTYGEITHGEKLTQVMPADPLLTPPKDWKIAGTPEPKVAGREFVNGKHEYPSDVARPGMMFGKVLRPSGFNANLISVDAGAAEKMTGVKVVRDGDFIGVAAPEAWTAEKAISAIQSKWNVPPQISNRELFDYLRNHPDTEDGARQDSTGSGRTAARAIDAEVKLEQHYTVEYIAHAPLEPRAAVAEWNGDKLTVWTGTQRPFGVRDELAETFRIPSSKVRVIMPDMGSGYGGKHSGECAVEAARLAKAAGKPVKLVWTREEEFTWAYFRPAGWIEIRSGATREGKLVAWECHNYNSGPSGISSPYNIENQVTQYHPAKSPLRQGSYRGLAATANHFARESHMDELAHQIGLDPLEFRMRNLTDPRLRAVFEAAAERFGWGRVKATAERGFGIAGGVEKGGYVATCAEVEVDPKSKTIKLRRIVEAWESGAIVNPNGLRNQIMGAVVQAIGGAMFEAIQFRDGRILNPHFAQYHVPRFSDTPEIDVVLVDRKDIPSAGAGEIGIVGLAPAIGNAVFSATGTRLRKMPMEL